MSLHLKTAMIQMIYAKSLRITSGVKSRMGVGSIVNLQSNDASKIWNMPLYLHIVWNGPFQVWVICQRSASTNHASSVERSSRQFHITNVVMAMPVCIMHCCPGLERGQFASTACLTTS